MANEYLQRTPTSTGNRKVFTWSAWVKRDTSVEGFCFGAGTSNSNRFALAFNGSGAEDITIVNTTTSNTIVLVTERKYRDFSSWIHFLVVVDTTRLEEENRVRFYINGDEENFRSGFQTYPGINDNVEYNNLNPHVIGTRGTYSVVNNFTGQMSDVFMVDGQALTPDVFGFYKEGKGYISVGSTQSTDFRPGQWVPKAPRTIKTEINRKGGFGVNGFYLPMNDSSNFGADFHTTPNSIITLKGEDLPQPRNGAPTTTDAYVSQLREDPYAANLVLALPFVSGGLNSGFGDYAPSIKGSGSAKVGTLGNSPSIGNTAGYYGSALSINGTGSATTGSPVITFASNADFNFGSSPYTIECWLNPSTNTSHDAGVIVVGDSGAQTAITYTNGVIRFRGVSGSVEISSPTYSQINEWFHTAIVRETGSNIKLYVNGVCVGVKTNFTSTLSQDKINIGAWTETGTYGFKGQIQDLRIYKGVAKYKGGFDVPKPYTPVGIATWRAVPDTTANNFATLNPLGGAGTLSDGNLKLVAGGIQARDTTFATTGNGKWYVEFRTGNVQNGIWEVIGIHPINKVFGPDRAYAANGQYWNGSAWVSFGTAWSNGDIIGLAYNQVAGEISFYLNGTLQGTTQSYTSSEQHYFVVRGNSGTEIICNFGQNPTFSGNTTAGTYTDSNGKGLFKYEPPSGFLALCEDNLPTPAIKNPGEYFKSVLYTGNGIPASSKSVVGVGFTPDLVWIKRRDGSIADHKLVDSVRGAGLVLESNTTDSEGVETNNFTAFTNDGFNLGANNATAWNESANYVAWCWKAGGAAVSNTDGTITSQVSANQDAGFSIVSYTGTGASGATVGHGLGRKPAMIIYKSRDDVSTWNVAHKGLGAMASQFLYLHSTAAVFTDTSLSGNTEPTSSVFGVGYPGSGVYTNKSGSKFIAYCWAEIEGFSKFGSYVGNGSADGPFVYCGFKPAWVMIKSSTLATNWYIFDSSRKPTNPITAVLFSNTSDLETDNAHDVDFLSNGFKVRQASGYGGNNSGATYIFAAFAESDFSYSNSK